MRGELRLVAFTTGLYVVLISMVGAFVPQHLSQCHDVNICNGAPGAISVALAIWIVKASENRISYGNTIEFNFLLTGLNLLLTNVVNNVCLLPSQVRTCECICLWPSFQSVRFSILWHRNLGSVWLRSWILLRGTNTLIPNRERGAISIFLAPLSLIWEGTQLASHYLLMAEQFAHLAEYAVCEWHVLAQWLWMLMQKNRHSLMEYTTGEHVILPLS
jgi:hypothetical protein